MSNEFIKRLTSSWKIIIGFVLAWVIITSIFLAIYPPQFEATAVIRIGKILGQPIETTQAAMVRLRSEQTLRKLSSQIDQPNVDIDEQIRYLNKKLRIQPIDERILQISITLKNKRHAIDALSELGQELMRQHQELNQQATNGMQENIKFLERAKSEIIGKIAAAKSVEAQNVICAQISNLVERELEVRADLLPPKTESTNFLFPVDALNQPIFPKPVMFYLLAVLLGVVCAMIRIFADDSSNNQ